MIDRRRSYLEQACSSLNAYCRERLRYSEDQAYQRVHVARFAARCPEVLTELASGTIYLTGLFLISQHGSEAEQRDLLSEARGKSRRELERLIAARVPRSDVKDSVVKCANVDTETVSRRLETGFRRNEAVRAVNAAAQTIGAPSDQRELLRQALGWLTSGVPAG